MLCSGKNVNKYWSLGSALYITFNRNPQLHVVNIIQMVVTKLRTILFEIIDKNASSHSKLLQGTVLNIKKTILAGVEIEEIPLLHKKETLFYCEG